MPIPASQPRIDRTFARDRIYQQLRDLIIKGDLEPGEILRDHSIAEQLGVSRTPVREALRRLEDEGLIETANNRWTRVTGIDLRQARELYQMVCALEGLALELAFPSLSRQHLQEMAGHNQALQNAIQAGEPTAAVQADERFHGVLIQLADSRELQNTLALVRTKLTRIELSYFAQQGMSAVSTEEHHHLLDALANRDEGQAQHWLKANWMASLTRWTEMQRKE